MKISLAMGALFFTLCVLFELTFCLVGLKQAGSGSKLKEKKIKDKIMAMPTTLGLNWGFVETN